MTKPRIPYGLDGAWLDPRDAGLDNIRPEQTVGLDPRDAGLGNIRPEQTVGLDPRDAGLGNIRPEQTVGLDPRDAGLDRRPGWFWSWMGRHWFGPSLR